VVRGFVAHYYWIVRSVVKEKPHLRKCLTRCRHCQILFFTHPRNAGRTDLGCPFGCRQAHRRKSSTYRSTEYYRSNEGKQKKKELNKGRSQQSRLAQSRLEEKGNDDDGRSKFDAATVSHIQVVTSLIEGRFVGLTEIFVMLDIILRQHSIVIGGKLFYDAGCGQKAPP
jgi:hypothetical protein